EFQVLVWLLSSEEDLEPNAHMLIGGATPSVFTAAGLPTGSSVPPTDPDDLDGDGLNDTWEQQYFGNITAQNATGDPDGDGLTNGQEQALGTDPTNPDTDGDGANDKDDPFPLDPEQGGTNTTTSTSSSSTSRSTSTSQSLSSTGDSAGGSGDGDDAGEVESFGDAVERLESDLGYVGMSAGGFLAVLILCIIALAVRWSL
ncbi:MAG TPA: hypothetical protein VJ874_05150, partial [Candidatus Thermoplasmatota archaeon]|nr:hypothetical protein [Candidatus Thermoplasmatota archaeon]